MAMDCPDDCCQGNIQTSNILQTQHHHKVIQCHILVALPHFSGCMLHNIIYRALLNRSSSFSYLLVFLHVLLQQGVWWRFSCCASWPGSYPHWERCKLHQEECTGVQRTECEVGVTHLPGQLCKVHSCLITSFTIHDVPKNENLHPNNLLFCSNQITILSNMVHVFGN